MAFASLSIEVAAARVQAAAVARIWRRGIIQDDQAQLARAQRQLKAYAAILEVSDERTTRSPHRGFGRG